MPNKFEDHENPQGAMTSITSRQDRTVRWGVANFTNESIEVAFGQLKSAYDIPNGVKDTGVIQICNNMPAGASCIRDPLVDTGGKPIAASYLNFSVLIGGQQIDYTESTNTGEGEYFVDAGVNIEYENLSTGDRTPKITFYSKRVKL